jgi:hypothetical protein
MEIQRMTLTEAVEAEKALTKRIDELNRTVDYHFKQLTFARNEVAILEAIRNAVKATRNSE